jgi:hypothetical protein
MITSTMRLTRLSIYYAPDDVVERVSIKRMRLIDTPRLEHCRRPADHARNLRTIVKAYSKAEDINDRCYQLYERPIGVHDAIVIDDFAYYVQPDGECTLVPNAYDQDAVWVCPTCEEPIVHLDRDAETVERLIQRHEAAIHNITPGRVA